MVDIMVGSLSKFKSNALKDKPKSWKLTVLRDVIYQGVQTSIRKGQVKNLFRLGFAVEVPADHFSKGGQKAHTAWCSLMKRDSNSLAVKREAWRLDAAWCKVTQNISIRNVHLSLQKAFSYEKLSDNMLSCLGYCDALLFRVLCYCHAREQTSKNIHRGLH